MRLVSFVVAAAVAGVASADTVDLKYLGTGAGKSVSISGPGPHSSVFAGQLRHEMDGQDVTTFCVEVAQLVGGGSAYTYDVVDLSAAPGQPGPMGNDRKEAVRVLYDLAGGAQFGANNTLAAAFQVALWELVFDFEVGDSASIDLQDGAFKLNSGGTVESSANAWLGQIMANYGSGSTALAGLHHDHKQDQVVVVPLPAPVALGLVGLIGVAGLRRLRMR